MKLLAERLSGWKSAAITAGHHKGMSVGRRMYILRRVRRTCREGGDRELTNVSPGSFDPSPPPPPLPGQVRPLQETKSRGPGPTSRARARDFTLRPPRRRRGRTFMEGRCNAADRGGRELISKFVF